MNAPCGGEAQPAGATSTCGRSSGPLFFSPPSAHLRPLVHADPLVSHGLLEANVRHCRRDTGLQLGLGQTLGGDRRKELGLGCARIQVTLALLGQHPAEVVNVLQREGVAVWVAAGARCKHGRAAETLSGTPSLPDGRAYLDRNHLSSL